MDKFVREEYVHALYFDGYSYALRIFYEIPSPWRAFYIPRGAEHEWRRESEKDRGSGHVLEDATDFLIVARDATSFRVDRHCWLLFHEDDRFSVLENTVFGATYSIAEQKRPVVKV